MKGRQTSNKKFSFNENNSTELLEDENTDRINVPINNPSGGATMFVNSKQYVAIQRRRIKKMNHMKLQVYAKLKNRVKYEKRSLHAKKRVRSQDGKFLTKTQCVSPTESSFKQNREKRRGFDRHSDGKTTLHE